MRIGYDDVSRAAFDRKIGALLSEFRTVNSVSELLAATSSYLNTDVLSDASKPKWQVEVEQDGWGKIRLHKVPGSDAGGVSFTTADGAHTFALSSANKGSKPLLPENLSFSYVGEQLHFQVDEEKYTVGGSFGSLKLNATQSLKRGGVQIKGIYNPSDPSSWRFGGILGSFPANTPLPTDMPPQTLFVGGLANKRNFLFERDEVSLEAFYLNPNIYSLGISYVFTDNHLGVGLDTNVLYMPNIPSFDKVTPFDIVSRLRLRYTF
ncbi:MAG: hypothetical protein QW568_02225 [Candidatus Anstonellaceae archaeon]